MCWRNKGPEEGARWEWCRLEEEVVNEGAEESNLIVVSYIVQMVWMAEVLTCQTNGRFFKFSTARVIASNLHTPPAALTPNAFAVFSLIGPLETTAIPRLATPKSIEMRGRRRNADMMAYQSPFSLLKEYVREK